MKDLKVMVLYKVRKQGSVIARENVTVLYLAHLQHILCSCAKYTCRTMTFSLTIQTLVSLLYTPPLPTNLTNFLIGTIFSYLFHRFFSHI